MKFAIFVVVLALALGAQSSVAPYWGGSATYTAVHGPTVYAAAPYVAAAPYAAYAHPHAAVSIAEHPYPLLRNFGALRTIPAVHAVHAAPVVVAAPLVAAEGTYVAKNRGAEHIAPLPGHANSASSINLEPAPGTF